MDRRRRPCLLTNKAINLALFFIAYFLLMRRVFVTVRGKEELKEFFKTGEIPSGEKFADFIDSYIASINGSMPDENGNVEVEVPFTVNPGIAVDDPPSAYPLGRTIGTFNYVPGQNAYVDSLFEPFNIPATTVTVITDRFGMDGRSIIIQQTDVMQDGAFIPTLTRSSNTEQTEWGPLKFIGSIRSIGGQTADLNGDIAIPSKSASVFYRSSSNQTINLAEPTMIFNNKDNNEISVTVDADTGIFTLDTTKKYAFHVNPVIQLINGASSVDYSMFSYDGTNFMQITSQRGHISNDGATMTGSAQGGYFVVDGSRYPQVAIRTVSIGGGAETRAYGFLSVYSHVLIQEL